MILQRTSSDKENGGSSSSSAVSFRNQSSVDGPPIDLAGISLEDSSNSSKEGDWGPQKRPLNADKGKNKTEFSASSAEPNDKAGLIVCPLGGPLENVIHEAANPPHPLETSRVLSSSSASPPAAANNEEEQFLMFSSNDLANEVD